MTLRPPAGARFEVERVSRRRSRGRATIVVWAMVIVAVAGFAIVGRVTDGPAPGVAGGASAGSSSTPPATDSVADLERLVPAPGDPVFRANAVDLQSPAAGPIVVLTPQLSVTGRMLVQADHVDIALEAGNDRVLEQVSVDVADHGNDLRPDWESVFRVTLDVPGPRPGGTMYVSVTAYDSLGGVIGWELRPFTVGPVKVT